MENGLKLVDNAVAVILFCAALFILIQSSREYTMQTAELTKLISEQKSVYEQQGNKNSEKLVSYEEVIGCLLSEITYDVYVGGHKFECEDYSYLRYDLSVIQKKSYEKLYEYDADGTLKTVVYR